MKLTILGCYSATPRAHAHTTAQVLELKNHTFLLDCGEGTQKQLRKHKINFNRIEHIFITHLHGDHVYGLIGFISSMSLLHREKALHIYGPKGIKEMICIQLKLSKSWTPYPLHFHELESKEAQLIYEDDKISVETIPLDHRVYTNGYLFKEKMGERKLLIEKVKKYDIDVSYYHSIKKGLDITLENGEVIPNHQLTGPPPPPQSYAFCTDTFYKPDIVPQIKNVDVLYHESTFQEDNLEMCAPTKHSTAKQAGMIAQMAQVKTLILGHYSSRYKNLESFRTEALQVFDQVEIAEDDKVFEFNI